MKRIINHELVKIRAFLPEKLTELSHVNEQLAMNLLRDWGDGKKPIREIWELAEKHLQDMKHKNVS